MVLNLKITPGPSAESKVEVLYHQTIRPMQKVTTAMTVTAFRDKKSAKKWVEIRIGVGSASRAISLSPEEFSSFTAGHYRVAKSLK